MVKHLQTYRTPGTPGQGIVRLKKEEVQAKLNEEEHSQYRSAVGMLLFLVKHSRPDLANPVRDLSKVLDGPTPAALKEVKRIIKYVLDTKDYGLNINPKSEWLCIILLGWSANSVEVKKPEVTGTIFK